VRVANRADGTGWRGCLSTGTQPGSVERETSPGDQEGTARSLMQCRSQLKGSWAGSEMGRSPATCKDMGAGGKSVDKHHLF